MSALRAIHWRQLTGLDLVEVEDMASRVHPDLFERIEIFAERLRLYPQGARLLELDGRPAGYVFSHPWRIDSLPELDRPLNAIPADANTYYIHDLALLPWARGLGAAGMIADDLIAYARRERYRQMSLVAVNGSVPFWQRHGFAIRDVPALRNSLASYQDGAYLMVRTLA